MVRVFRFMSSRGLPTFNILFLLLLERALVVSNVLNRMGEKAVSES